MSDTVIRVENISKLYRLGEVGTGSLAHDVNRWWHRVRGKEDPYLKIGEVNDRTKSVSSVQRPESSAKTAKRNLTTEDTESTEVGAGGNQRSDSAEFSEGHSQAGLQMDSEKLASIRSANDSRASGEQTGSDSESVKFDSLDPSRLAPAGLPSAVSRAAAQPPGCGKNSSSALDSGPSPLKSSSGLRAGEFFAVQDVSFELRRGELRTLGRSEKEISKKCLGATKVPDSGRRRHQCLGLIGHNGALPALLAVAG
jgi:hypothetical protein